MNNMFSLGLVKYFKFIYKDDDIDLWRLFSCVYMMQFDDEN